MSYLPLLISLNSLIIAQSLYSMEKQVTDQSKNSEYSVKRRKSPLSLSSKNISTIKPKQPTTDPMSISITTSSESTDYSQTHPLKSTKHISRSKTTDNAPIKHKESSLTKIFSSSEGINFSRRSPRNKISILTDAVRNYDLDTIQTFIDNPDANLNQKDKWGNTPLHRAVLLTRDKINNKDIIQKMIDLLLFDPRTDTSLVNDNLYTAPQLLQGGEYPELRTKLFARNTIDMTINNEIGKILFNSYMDTISLNDELIKQSATNIIKNILNTESSQKEKLPEEAKLPEYANDDFIFNMIKKRLPSESKNISEFQRKILQKVFSQEIEMFLLGAVTNESLAASKKIIEQTINKHQMHAHLIPFMPYVFHALKVHAEQTKPKNNNLFENMITQINI
jgi:hypothetical protein